MADFGTTMQGEIKTPKEDPKGLETDKAAQQPLSHWRIKVDSSWKEN
jgi:hypothetical protein